MAAHIGEADDQKVGAQSLDHAEEFLGFSKQVTPQGSRS